MISLHKHLSEIKDFRRAQGKRISLPSFLEMVVLAGMSGRFGINSISRFINNNSDFFIERYGLLHGVPKKTSVFNILKELSFDDLSKAIQDWAIQFIDKSSDVWVAIDGKVVGSTVTDMHGSKQNYVSIVSLFNTEMGITIGAASIENKTESEGEAARELIKKLEGKGITFTLDAHHCQKKRRKLSWSQEMTM